MQEVQTIARRVLGLATKGQRNLQLVEDALANQGEESHSDLGVISQRDRTGEMPLPLQTDSMQAFLNLGDIYAETAWLSECWQ